MGSTLTETGGRWTADLVTPFASDFYSFCKSQTSSSPLRQLKTPLSTGQALSFNPKFLSNTSGLIPKEQPYLAASLPPFPQAWSAPTHSPKPHWAYPGNLIREASFDLFTSLASISTHVGSGPIS